MTIIIIIIYCSDRCGGRDGRSASRTGFRRPAAAIAAAAEDYAAAAVTAAAAENGRRRRRGSRERVLL